MKKVIVLTFSKVYNRGANLQCYALMSHLINNGFAVEFLDIQLPKKKTTFKGRIYNYINNLFAQRFRKKVNMKFTAKYLSYDHLLKNPPKADVYVVGSDQVWNPALTNSLDPRVYFLCFAPNNIKKVSYAASFGRDTWFETKHDKEIIESLKTFSAVSVREKSGVDICKNEFNLEKIEHVLDPSLFLNYKSLLKLFNYNKVKRKKQIYCYLLYKDDEILDIVHDVSNILELNPFGISSKGIKNKLNQLHGVSKWLKDIYSSDFIITNSFHCMVVCILLHKNFIVVSPSPGLETRIQSLLKIIDLEERFIPSLQALHDSKEIIIKEINYSKVDYLLEQERVKSFAFIDKNIIEE